MQKQQKRKKIVDRNKKLVWKKRRKRHANYLQKTIKNSGRPYFNIISTSLSERNYLRTDISVFPNNVFCSLRNTQKNKLICQASAGKYKVKVSKKSLKYSSKIIITNFFRELKQKNVNFSKPILLVIVAPSNLKKKMLLNVLNLLKYVKNKRIIVVLKAKKIFNGCRAKKQIRKKQKRHAIYK